ncbi:MAG: hypothetical protein NWE95_03370 [Candidatus Bathyarchaeota archaeon]|nr:hypothetical protein [Candidatus Bathyarchaeota archaeon]
MVLRGFGRSRRGLSTVVSTILMIMVVMIGMSILFGYVAFYSQTYQAGVGGSVLEHLTVEDIWIRDEHAVQITVYNAGTRANLGTDVDFEVATIFVNGSPLINVKDDAGSNGGTINFNEQTVEAGKSATFLCSWEAPKQFVSGQTYTFKVVTMRSSSFEVSHYYAP